MRSPAAHPVASCPHRLLAFEARTCLEGRRLPRYSALAARLMTVAYRGSLRALWRDLVPDVPPATQIEVLEEELIRLVHYQYFPLDLDLLGEDADNGDGLLLTGTIPIEGQGLGEYYPEADDPCDDAIAPLRFLVDPELHYRDRDCWWRQRGRTPPSELAPLWLGAEHEPIIRALAALPSPLSALADLYKMIHRITRNVFLDTGPRDWNDVWGWGWCADDIRALAQDFRAAQAPLARCQEYYNWFANTPDAEARIISLLLTLELPQEPAPCTRTLAEVFAND